MARFLHVSNSPYASLADTGPSLAIFRELARGAEAYHVLAQADGRPVHDREGHLHLHTLPGARGRTFAFTSLAMAGHVRRHRIDAIVCQDPVLGGIAALAVGRALRVPVLLEVHTDRWFDLADARSPAARALGRAAIAALKQATLVRTSGSVLTAALVARGIDPARVREVPYRVDTQLFAPPAPRPSTEAPLAVSVGRFVPQKGYLELLDALVEVPSLRLVLAGGGPLEDDLAAKASRLGLDDRVELKTWISREEQRDLLQAADAYLQPSIPGLGDWMPRTILEAMATELPVVAADIGGIPDVLTDGVDGLLVRGGDPAALVAALQRLVGDPELRAQLGAGALRTAQERFAWDVAFDRYRALLDELAAARSMSASARSNSPSGR